MSAFSPMTRPALCTSPSTRPSIWMSPVDVSVPLTTRSLLMMDGTDERVALLPWGPCGTLGTAGGALSLSRLLLENMAPCLDKLARISQHIGQPHFVVHVRPGASPCRPEFSNGRTFNDFGSNAHEYRRKMTITCAESISVVDLDHIPIAAARAGPDNRAGCRCGDR